MSLARFYSRISDAITPLMGVDADLETFLGKKVVSLEAPERLEENPIQLAGFLLAANLCARLYPNIRIIGPQRVADQAKLTVLQINPVCNVETGGGQPDATLAWCSPAKADNTVIAGANGWNAVIDLQEAERINHTNVLVSLTAAALGVGELFRIVFAEFLARGRSQSVPGSLNVLTLDANSQSELAAALPRVDIGRVHLVGAGAVGQAVLYTLARVEASGSLLVVDPEDVALSNLQRYVLTGDSDVGQSKCALAVRAMSGSGIEVLGRQREWGDEEDADAEAVCVAVDTEALRIAIQAGLPRMIYNAWTQPADLGWSRHESFGTEPCLACLYWPTRPRPSQHELIAKALKQAELRVLAYLTHRLPVDQALKAEQIPRIAVLPVPPDSGKWVERSLLADIVESLGIADSDVAQWKGKELADLYREGICGGALVRHQTASFSNDVAVPLAHQSVLAGIMLASQLLIAQSPDLRRQRPTEPEARLDVLSGLPQIVVRPRKRSDRCICSDSDFIERYETKWGLASLVGRSFREKPNDVKRQGKLPPLRH